MRALVVIAVLLAASPARADGFEALEEARALKAKLEWDEALEAVRSGIAAGGNNSGMLAQMYMMVGTLHAGLEHPGEAADAFARALAIEPDAFLEDGESPTIQGPFQQARARTAALRFHLEQERRGGELAITVVLDDDRWNLVARGRIGTVQAPASGGRIVLVTPIDASSQRIELLDEHGNVLRLELVDPPGERPSPPVPPEVYHRPRWYKRVELWGALTLVTGVVGGLAAWGADAAQDEWNDLRADDGAHDYSELVAVEARGRRYTTVANLMIPCAVVGAVITAIRGIGELADRKEFREEHRTSTLTPGPAVTITAGPHDLGVVLAGTF